MSANPFPIPKNVFIPPHQRQQPKVPLSTLMRIKTDPQFRKTFLQNMERGLRSLPKVRQSIMDYVKERSNKNENAKLPNTALHGNLTFNDIMYAYFYSMRIRFSDRTMHSIEYLLMRPDYLSSIKKILWILGIIICDIDIYEAIYFLVLFPGFMNDINGSEFQFLPYMTFGAVIPYQEPDNLNKLSSLIVQTSPNALEFYRYVTFALENSFVPLVEPSYMPVLRPRSSYV